MNNLNSVLIEGELETNPEASQNEANPVCSFRLLTVRKDQPFHFLVVTHGHLAEICSECLKAGRRVRVVGSLHEEDGGVWILAEHVEFRPTPKENADED